MTQRDNTINVRFKSRMSDRFDDLSGPSQIPNITCKFSKKSGRFDKKVVGTQYKNY